MESAAIVGVQDALVLEVGDGLFDGPSDLVDLLVGLIPKFRIVIFSVSGCFV